MLHLFTCQGRIMPRLAELLLKHITKAVDGLVGAGCIRDPLVTLSSYFSVKAYWVPFRTTSLINSNDRQH